MIKHLFKTWNRLSILQKLATLGLITLALSFPITILAAIQQTRQQTDAAIDPSYISEEQLIQSKLSNRRLVKPPVSKDSRCKIGGCSGELCLDLDAPDLASTCQFKEEYACYQKLGKCQTQPDGQCGWTQTDELSLCLENGGVISSDIIKEASDKPTETTKSKANTQVPDSDFVNYPDQLANSKLLPTSSIKPKNEIINQNTTNKLPPFIKPSINNYPEWDPADKVYPTKSIKPKNDIIDSAKVYPQLTTYPIEDKWEKPAITNYPEKPTSAPQYESYIPSELIPETNTETVYNQPKTQNQTWNPSSTTKSSPPVESVNSQYLPDYPSGYYYEDTTPEKITCTPRPACLDAQPPCNIAYRSDWCPPTAKTINPTPIPLPTPAKTSLFRFIKSLFGL